MTLRFGGLPRYGGIERAVSWLTEELVKMGHDVTPFASTDSQTRAKLVAGAPYAVRLVEDTADPQAFHFAMLEDVVRASGQFDIVHFHTDYMGFPYTRRLDAAHVTTLHWRLDVPGLDPLYRRFADVPLVSISNAQRAPLPWAGWIGTVPHGMPATLLPSTLTRMAIWHSSGGSRRRRDRTLRFVSRGARTCR
ncbi:protein of unknown function (plasmid) [Caballeronia sp. S22]